MWDPRDILHRRTFRHKITQWPNSADGYKRTREEVQRVTILPNSADPRHRLFNKKKHIKVCVIPKKGWAYDNDSRHQGCIRSTIHSAKSPAPSQPRQWADFAESAHLNSLILGVKDPCLIITPLMGQSCRPEQPLGALNLCPHLTPPMCWFCRSPLWSKWKCMVITLLFCWFEQSLDSLNWH